MKCYVIDKATNVKKLQFIHKLTARDISETAKVTKGWLPTSTSPKCQCTAEWYYFFVIFAVLDVSLTVNLCLNIYVWSFKLCLCSFCPLAVFYPGLPSLDHWTGPDIIMLISLFLVCFSLKFCLIPCNRLTWLPLSFWLHAKYTVFSVQYTEFSNGVWRCRKWVKVWY